MEFKVTIQEVTETLRRQVAAELAGYYGEPFAAPEGLVPATDAQVAEWVQDQIDNALDNLHETFGDV